MALGLVAATFVTFGCEEEGPIVNKHPQKPDPTPGDTSEGIWPEGTYYPEEIPTLDEYVGLPTPLAEVRYTPSKLNNNYKPIQVKRTASTQGPYRVGPPRRLVFFPT